MGDRRWLDGLYSIYAYNLSKRVTWSVIKGIFEEYGKVVDLYILKWRFQDQEKMSIFAFIRYREQHEMEKALQWGGH